ncbi:MAG: 6-phosphofructokinase, partial [candidate division KSB1 bacterium]
MESSDYQIETLGECQFDSPLGLPVSTGAGIAGYVSDTIRILVNLEQHAAQHDPKPMTLEKAGAREKIYFRPGYTKAAIVTCGGLSPGLNNVIRSLFMQLYHRYGVKNVVGLRNGYRGLNPQYGFAPMTLTPDVVERIHRIPGTILGTSRTNPFKVSGDLEKLKSNFTKNQLMALIAVGGEDTLGAA